MPPSQDRADSDNSAGAPAQEKDQEKEQEPSNYVLVEVEKEGIVPSQSAGVTKLRIPLRQIPLSVGVVSEGLMDAQAAEVLGDALRNVSGTVAHTGFGVFDYFTIRGFDSLSGGLVLTDGVPEPEATFYHLYNIDRVEVLKGPGAFLYGGNPLAGSVNLVRKGPVFENLSRIGGSFGSFSTVRGTLDLNRVNSEGNLAFRLNLFGRSSNGYRDSKDNWQGGVNPALSFQLSPSSILTVNFEYNRNEYHSDSGIPLYLDQIADVPRTRSYQSPFDASDQNVYRARIDFSKALGHSAVLRNKFYYTELEWTSDGTIFPAVLPSQSGSVDVYRSLLRLDDRQRLFGNQTEVSAPVQTGSVRHDLLAGFEVSRLADVFTLDIAVLPAIDLYDPLETAAPPLYSIPSLGQAGDSRNWVIAPYLLDSITISDRLRLLAGGRFDGLDFEDSVAGLNRDSRTFSPLLGLSYSLSPDLALYANFGQGFAPPSSQVVGEREPEKSRQFEFGGKVQLVDQKLLMGVAVYDLQRMNIAIPDQTGVLKQQGDQRSRGVEIDLTGELPRGFYLFGSYAFTNAELTRYSELIDPSFGQFPPLLVDLSGNTPAFAPKHISSISVLRKFRNSLTLGLGCRYLSDQFIAPDNRFAIDGSLTFDASVAYHLDTWQLSLNFKNLTGREYETRGFGSTSVIPGDPFAVYLGVDFLR
jgi:iron complex outermembrane receptor protein